MKWAVTLLCCLSLAPAELTGTHTVYLLPMGHSLDQFIANRLIRMHVLQVVADPAKADSIITDQLGMPFENRLKDLYPPPPDPQAKEAAKAKETAAKEKTDQSSPNAFQSPASILANTSNKAESAGSMGVGGRGRGTIFLVDVKSRQVLWSAFEKPKNSSPHELDHTAERVVKQLKQDLTPKTK